MWVDGLVMGSVRMGEQTHSLSLSERLFIAILIASLSISTPALVKVWYFRDPQQNSDYNSNPVFYLSRLNFLWFTSLSPPPPPRACSADFALCVCAVIIKLHQKVKKKKKTPDKRHLAVGIINTTLFNILAPEPVLKKCVSVPIPN